MGAGAVHDSPSASAAPGECRRDFPLPRPCTQTRTRSRTRSPAPVLLLVLVLSVSLPLSLLICPSSALQLRDSSGIGTSAMHTSTDGEAGPSDTHLDLRVMSFNIRYGTADDGPDAWSHRKHVLFDVLSQAHADVVGLQEALHFQLEEISQQLSKYAVLGVGREDGKLKGEYGAILYRSDRFSVEENDSFWLSGLPNIPNSMTWGNVCTRICTWARLRDKRTGVSFLLYNTHLDHQGVLSRELGVRLIVSRMKQTMRDQEAVLLTGDFNVDETDAVVHFLVNTRSNLTQPEPPYQKPEVCLMAPYGGYSCGTVHNVMTRMDRQDRTRLVFLDTFRHAHPLAPQCDEKCGGPSPSPSPSCPQPSLPLLTLPAGLKEATYHAFSGRVDGGPIDFILLANQPAASVLDSHIVRFHRDGRYPSDHYPITSTIRLPVPPPPQEGPHAAPSSHHDEL